MVKSAFIMLTAGFIDGLEFVSQARPIGNDKTQWPYAVAGIHIPCKADADRQEARLFALSILPPLAKFRCNGRIIRVAPLEFQRDIGSAPFVAIGRGRFAAA